MDLYIPDNVDSSTALQRTTHLGVGAHQDDLEFMAIHGILECFQKPHAWFSGITITDGAGSARTGPYARYTDEEMKAVRLSEQRKAALIGQYGFMAQLQHPSSVLKTPDAREALVDELTSLLKTCNPDVVYTHNPIDKHATHIGVVIALLEAVRRLPAAKRPRSILGCEVWRDLDWLPDAQKVVLDSSSHPDLVAALNGVFDSQITGGKRYDRAVLGRRRANATFLESHAIDTASEVTFAIDLTPLVQADAPSLKDFITGRINSFKADAIGLLESLQ